MEDIPNRNKENKENKDNPAEKSKDASYPGQVVENVTRAGNELIQPIRNTFDSISQTMDASNNAKPETKAVAAGLAVAEGALSMFGNIMGLTNKLIESALMPIMQQLSFLQGLAILPVLKQTDPVMGIDIHNVIIPPSPVVPMPHPYIGILFRPKDFLSCSALEVISMLVPPEITPEGDDDNAIMAAANMNKAVNIAVTASTMAVGMLGASVKIGNFLPRAVAGTITKSVPHIPMGAGFSLLFMGVEKNVGHSYLGSLLVLADNEPLSGAIAHLHNDCWDLGAVNLHTEEGVPMGARLYVPSGIQTSIPTGRPVLVNPIPTPVNPVNAIKKKFKGGLGKLKKNMAKNVAKLKDKARKSFQKVLDKIAANPKLKKAFGGCPRLTKLSKKYGTNKSHPVDVASGHFFTDHTDFSLPGVIPVTFERDYYSNSDYNGPLGIGWHHSYDMAIAFDFEEKLAAYRLPDGRTTGFELPERGESFFNRKEKLWLHRSDKDQYSISDQEGLIYSFTEKEYANPYNKHQSHLLQSISNRNGYSIRLSYNREGILEKIIDSAGRDLIFENDGKGHITAIYIPDPSNTGKQIKISSYEYDEERHLTAHIDALGHAMRFEYDGLLMTKETWRNGLSWHVRYEGKGIDARCVEISGDNGLMHYKLKYVSPNCTLVTDSLGNETPYYHKDGLVTKHIELNDGVYEYRYNEYSELEWTTDPLGNGEGETQDEWGNLVTRTAADGGFTYLQYENLDFPYLPTSATDAAGGKWLWEYDEQGNLSKRTDPLGAESVFTYTDGLLTMITGAEGQQTRLEYDREGNLTKTVSPDGGINRWRYDLLGQCLSHENAKGGTTEYAYDLLGQVVKVKEADGNTRVMQYDPEGNVVHVKDADREVVFGYRGVNKLAMRSERGATLRFRYDSEDQLREVENEKGECYTFRLDAQGDVVEETGFDGLTRKYYRDLAGQVTETVRPDGRIIAYEYDPAGRVTKVTYNPGDKKEQREERYEYRRDGVLVKAVNEHAEVVLERDILGRVVKEICNGSEVISEYDLSGNRTRIKSSSGANIEAEYNLMGDVVSLANGGWKTQYQRDLFGLETGRTFSGGVRSQTDRDRLGRVISHQTEKNNRLLSKKSYLWGVNDKLLGIVSNGKTKNFEYDTWGNLSKTVFEDGKVEHRNPDNAGNLFESLDRLDRKYTEGGRLEKTANWEYKYDKEGNLIRRKDRHGATWRYEWNAAGMLERVKRPDAMEVTFKYDALGRRIEKEFGSLVTRWVWDGNVPLHEQKTSYRRDWDSEKGIYWEENRQPLVTWMFEEGTFVPVAKLTEEKTLSIATNYLGTPEAMYRDDGEAVWTCELNSYGRVRSFQGQYKTDCPFRYQGQYEDSETGLYYNRFRYYSPEEGIYISQDPIGIEGGSQLYGYVHDTNGWVDSKGLSKSCPPKGGVYVLMDNGVVVRTGRTKNLKRRARDHARNPKTKHLTFVDVYKTDDYNAQRGLEHKIYKLHESTASQSNGGLNKIAAIRDTNPNKPTYITAADKYLENLNK